MFIFYYEDRYINLAETHAQTQSHRKACTNEKSVLRQTALLCGLVDKAFKRQ